MGEKQHLTVNSTGRWLVTTLHSEYVFDLDDPEGRTAKRIAGKNANRWHYEDVTYPIVGEFDVHVGESMVLCVDHPDVWVRSTPVISIVPVWDDAA